MTATPTDRSARHALEALRAELVVRLEAHRLACLALERYPTRPDTLELAIGRLRAAELAVR